MKLQEYTASAHNFEECMKCTICTKEGTYETAGIHRQRA